MQELESFKFSNPFADLPEDFFHKQNWTPFDNPKLIHFNKELAELLGFPKGLNAEDLVPYINGNKAFKHSAPLSMAYAGHQFGSWVPQLGDGRGILFRANTNQRRFDGFTHQRCRQNTILQIW